MREHWKGQADGFYEGEGDLADIIHEEDKKAVESESEELQAELEPLPQKKHVGFPRGD